MVTVKYPRPPIEENVWSSYVRKMNEFLILDLELRLSTFIGLWCKRKKGILSWYQKLSKFFLWVKATVKALWRHPATGLRTGERGGGSCHGNSGELAACGATIPVWKSAVFKNCWWKWPPPPLSKKTNRKSFQSGCKIEDVHLLESHGLI